MVRDRVAAEIEEYARSLTDAAVTQVIDSDDAGFGAMLRAAAIQSAAQFVRGEVR
jgi:hypothetical protein